MVNMSWLHVPSVGVRLLLFHSCTLGESGFDSLGKYFVSLSSMSRKMCSLSGKTKKETRAQSVDETKGQCDQAEIFQTIACN